MKEQNNLNSLNVHNTMNVNGEGQPKPSEKPKSGGGTNRSADGAAGVVCGDFTVNGGTPGTDFRYENNVLTILTGTPVAVSGTTARGRIYVESGVNASITLNNVNIEAQGDASEASFEIAEDSIGNVTVTLAGKNVLKGAVYCAGLQKNGGVSSGTLTIQGSGSLDVTAGFWAAAIGGGKSARDLGTIAHEGSNIIIKSGTVTATAREGAGIGGSHGAAGNNITINSGNVTARANNGAAIGGGSGGAGNNIRISGGTVTAESLNGAAIGGGDSGAGNNIGISGGAVTATSSNSGAGIGGGDGGAGNNITLSGGSITAASAGSGAGIGGGSGGAGNNIRINGADVTASSVKDGAGIGGGSSGTGRNIRVVSGTVKAKSGCDGAGIGGGFYGAGSNIEIRGGSVTAASGGNGAGIGGGDFCAGSDITISGGAVTAAGGGAGAGIGGGGGGKSSYITISSGTVTAKSANGGAGIGGGKEGTGSNIRISGSSTVVYAKASSESFFRWELGENIGSGGGVDVEFTDDSVQRGGGLIIEGGTGHIYGSDVTLKDDFTIESGVCVHIDGEKPDTRSLTVAGGVNLTNNGTVRIYPHNKLNIDGTVTNNGAIIYENEEDINPKDKITGDELKDKNDSGSDVVDPDKPEISDIPNAEELALELSATIS